MTTRILTRRWPSFRNAINKLKQERMAEMLYSERVRSRLSHTMPQITKEDEDSQNGVPNNNQETKSEETPAASSSSPSPSVAAAAPVLQYCEGGTLPENAPSWAVAASDRLQAKKKAQEEEQKKHGIKKDEGEQRSIGKVLLHSCCAPCSGAMVEEMMHRPEIEKVVVFCYNPNIHPRREYEIRKQENKDFCARLGIDFVDVDYNSDAWYSRMKGMEMDPERGRRCTECFDMRMERTAQYAHEHGFQAIATTNATSRWKDVQQVNGSGYRAAQKFQNEADPSSSSSLIFLGEDYNDWQSDEMTLRKYQISASERFYKQEYCGCSYSLRDSNAWRDANGIPRIRIGGELAGLGNRYFTNPEEDAAEEAQDVVDEFFAAANTIAAASTTNGKNNKDGENEKDDDDDDDDDDEVSRQRRERKKALEIYKNRRKSEKNDGVLFGLNNW